MRPLALILCLIATPSMAAQPAYVGAWADTDALCKGDSRMTSDSPFRISRKVAEGYEWRCQIAQASRHRGGWIARMSCADAGYEFTRVVRWRLTPDKKLRETEKGKAHDFVRCKDSDYRGFGAD